MKISQGFEQATKGDGYTVYKLAISKDEEIVRYGDESMVGKTFEIHTDVGKRSKGKYLSLFLPMDYDVKNFLVEKNFDKVGKMLSCYFILLIGCFRFANTYQPFHIFIMT